MSKNITRKSIALGSATALVVAGFSGLPANALGLADTTFVSLTPTTGTEYSVLASDTGSGATFSLASNEASTVSTGDLKFLVTDPNSWVEPTIATEGRALAIADDAVVTVTDSATATVTITDANHTLSLGDKFYLDDDLNLDTFVTDAGPAVADFVVAADDTIFTVSAATAGVSYSFVAGDATSVEADLAGAVDVAGGTQLFVIREARTTTGGYAGTFVIDSGSTNAANVENITLASDSLETRSVTVQAWMDANDNDQIDAVEYASPVRTVTWVKSTDLTVSTSITPVSGDANLEATVTTSPVLNGEQTAAFDADWLNVGFTRQDDTTVLYGDDGIANPLATWSDVTKTWTVKVATDADDATVGSSTVTGLNQAGWGILAGAINQSGTGAGADGDIDKIVVAATGVVTVTTDAAHNYRVGDKLDVVIDAAAEDAKAASADEDGVVVTSVPSTTTFTYTVSAASPTAGTADDAVAELDVGTTISVVTYGAGVGVTDRVFAGTYTAQAYVLGVKAGALASAGTIAAATASATLTSVGTAAVTGNTVSTDIASDQTIKVGTASADFVVTALDADGDALGAGRTVVVTTEAPVDGGATIGTFKVNGGASATLSTDANGQVSFTVTTSDTSANAQTRVSALVENAVTVGMDLHWDAQAYTLVDFGTTAGTIATDAAIARTTTAGGSYTLELAVADQWFQNAPSANYDIVVSGSGVTEGVRALVDGRANVTITDAGITAVGGTFTTTVALRKDAVAVSTHTVTTTIAATPAVKLGADGSTTYAPGGNVADLSDKVAAKALVEIDQRSVTTATPAYANDVLVQGMVANSITSAAVANAYVTLSGPSNILFSNDKVASRGSITLLSDANGEFEVNLYSTSAQTDTVITVTAMGASSTTKVSFTGIGVGEGTSLVVTTPAAVKPASTFQVKAKLADAYGNGVDTAAGRVKVTYTGAGIVFGTLPTETDANGELQFSVLLGSNDTGTVSVTVSYDQNGDADYVDAKDLTTTSTTEITASGVASSEQKVNAGSFKGYVALYAKGYAGQRMSAKVGKDWVVVPALASDFERVVEFTGAGVDVAVRIYIDRVLMDTINLTTK